MATMSENNNRPTDNTEDALKILFVKHNDFGLPVKEHYSTLQLCREVAKITGNDAIEGAQRIRGLWRIYLKNDEAKRKLLIEGINIRGKSVVVSETNPFVRSEPEREQPTIKCFIHDLPLGVSNEAVQKMLASYGGVTIGEVEHDIEKDEERKSTGLKNGSRVVLLSEAQALKEPLPRNATCGNWRCRIYHRGQPKVIKTCFNCFQTGHWKRDCKNARACKVCKKGEHLEGSEDCEFFAPNDAIVLKGENDKLSNFHPCKILWKDINFSSSEHIYQWEKAQAHGRRDIAAEIESATSAKQARLLSHNITTMAKWEENNTNLMMQILQEKIEQNPDIKEELLGSGEKIIAECVPNAYLWSCGLTKEAASNTHPDKWPGKNVMGEMLMHIRETQRENDKENIELDSEDSEDDKRSEDYTQEAGTNAAESPNDLIQTDVTTTTVSTTENMPENTMNSSRPRTTMGNSQDQTNKLSDASKKTISARINNQNDSRMLKTESIKRKHLSEEFETFDETKTPKTKPRPNGTTPDKESRKVRGKSKLG
jgi:ribA/ribD-fused uncharacterized protein